MKGNKCIELPAGLPMARRRRSPTHHSDDDLDSLFPEQGKPVQRNAANARERARMRVLSRAFSRLKTSLPWVPPDTKLSKLDTLRLAATYIAHLRKVLRQEDTPAAKKPHLHPVTFTWPFTISNRPGSNSEDSATPSIAGSRDLPEHHDVQPAYPNYPPCEYMSVTYSDQPRTEMLGQFLH